MHRKWQRPAPGDRTQQCRGDDRALPLNNLRHVEVNEGSCVALTHLKNQFSVYRPISCRTFFRDAENPMV